jgi:hypothetical protein
VATHGLAVAYVAQELGIPARRELMAQADIDPSNLVALDRRTD